MKFTKLNLRFLKLYPGCNAILNKLLEQINSRFIELKPHPLYDVPEQEPNEKLVNGII